MGYKPEACFRTVMKIASHSKVCTSCKSVAPKEFKLSTDEFYYVPISLIDKSVISHMDGKECLHTLL
ncbi:hypothetical protein XELAEV_18030755mg [Xenopus laevis]|uniref:Uncharacterized protein n=1 Tax=Xenopus laevis TaxID=8355 RepID=A0A974HF34_XENLA|nr:hypothetical protein XELAEV_18030755mg [Xenopus laevis]